MATGYTAPIEDGTITSFKEFAFKCAHAFGANIELRDSSKGTDAEIPEYKPSDYHLKAMQEAIEKSDQYHNYAKSDWETKMAAVNSDAEKSHYARVEETAIKLERYAKMRDKVEAWTPPTPEHVDMKKFMLEQIDSSTTWMGSISGKGFTPPHAKWEDCRDFYISSALRDIEYHSKHYNEEVERVSGRNQWNKALFKSLDEYEEVDV